MKKYVVSSVGALGLLLVATTASAKGFDTDCLMKGDETRQIVFAGPARLAEEFTKLIESGAIVDTGTSSDISKVEEFNSLSEALLIGMSRAMSDFIISACAIK